MKYRAIQVAVLFSVLIISSCGILANIKARGFYHKAVSHFESARYDQTIDNINRVLKVLDGGRVKFSSPPYICDGSIWLLRGLAYEALGARDESIKDYRAAIIRGNEYTSSTALSSNPKPGAKSEWFRSLSRYHNSLGIAYARAGKYEDALAEFMNAIEVAGASVNRIGLTDRLVANVFGGEKGKHKEFAKVVGAYVYNVGIMEERLNRPTTAKKIAMQLNYDKKYVFSTKWKKPPFEEFGF